MENTTITALLPFHQKDAFMATAVINLSVDVDVKNDADAIFSQLGMTTNDALRMFLKQTVLLKGLPLATRVADMKSSSPQQEKINLTKKEAQHFRYCLEHPEVFEDLWKRLASEKRMKLIPTNPEDEL